MSCTELIESLRKAADERARAMWREAERQAEEAKAEWRGKLARLREETDRSRHAGSNDALAMALAEANNKARMLRLSGEHKLCERLLRSAVASLPLLRNGQYVETFAKMAQELPGLPWKQVKVNPGDVAPAQKHFPGAEIVPDPSITGGMDASIAEGSIRIVNTLEKRLERAWSELLPGLVKEVRRELSKGTA